MPTAPGFDVSSHEEFNSALKNNFGARLQFHGDSWDLSLAGYYGAAQLPIFKVHVVGDLESAPSSGNYIIQLKNPIQIDPVEYLRQTYAAGFVKTFADTWVFRIAGRYDQPIGHDPLLGGPTDQFVGGFEKTYTVFEQTMTLSLQYAYAKTLDKQTGVLTITDPFENAFLYGMRLPFNDKTLLYYSGLWSHLIGATYNRFRLEQKLASDFTLELTADLIRGPPDNLLGIWANESRGSIGFLWQF